MKIVAALTYAHASKLALANGIVPIDRILLAFSDEDIWSMKLASIHKLREEDVIGIRIEDLERSIGRSLRT